MWGSGAHRAGGGLLLVALAWGLAGCGMAMEDAPPVDKAGLYRSSQKDPASRRFHEAVLDVSDGRYAAAERSFRALGEALGARGDARRAAEALFWAGYCQEKLGRADAATATYRQVLREYPEQPAAEQAQWRLKRLDAAGTGD